MTDTTLSTTLEVAEPSARPKVDELLAAQVVAIGDVRRFFADHPVLEEIGVGLYPNHTHEGGRGGGVRALICCRSADELARATRALIDRAPLGSIEKKADAHHQSVIRDFGAGAVVEAYAVRSEVCERVVVGVETVEVPDPNAPKVTIEREKVEWRCAPVLAGGVSW